MIVQARSDLSDIASRLLQDGGFVLTYYESPEPSGSRRYLHPRRERYLTRKGEAALEHAEEMDRLILQAFAIVMAKLGGAENAQIIWQCQGEEVDLSELQPYLDGLVEQGCLVQAVSGEYALTQAGERKVMAYDEAHPTWTGNFRVIDPSWIDRRTRDEARELARNRRQERLRTAEELWP
jgi:predicted transcriptional regulator